MLLLPDESLYTVRSSTLPTYNEEWGWLSSLYWNALTIIVSYKLHVPDADDDDDDDNIFCAATRYVYIEDTWLLRYCGAADVVYV